MKKKIICLKLSCLPILFFSNLTQVESKLYVVGGNVEDGYGFPVPIITIEVYSPNVDQWTICRTTCNIREAGAAVHDNKMYIVGGINGEHRYSDLLQEYGCANDKMVTLELPNRVIGKACCVLTLPPYLSSIWPLWKWKWNGWKVRMKEESEIDSSIKTVMTMNAWLMFECINVNRYWGCVWIWIQLIGGIIVF